MGAAVPQLLEHAHVVRREPLDQPAVAVDGSVAGDDETPGRRRVNGGDLQDRQRDAARARASWNEMRRSLTNPDG